MRDVARAEADQIRSVARADADRILAEAAASRPAGPRHAPGEHPPEGWFVTRSGPRRHRFWDGGAWVGSGWTAPDSVFVSYSRADADAEAVRDLVADLRGAQVQVWLDEELPTGVDWWEEILRRIREAAVFLHVLSDASVRSTACQHERRYAEALGIPVVPVQVAPTDLRTTRYGTRQIVDYLQPTRRLTARLVADVLRAIGRREPLPTPLPDPPPAPFGYLVSLSERLDAAELSMPEQLQLVHDMIGYLEDAAEQDGHLQIRVLLRRLQERGDTARRVSGMIQALLVEG